MQDCTVCSVSLRTSVALAHGSCGWRCALCWRRGWAAHTGRLLDALRSCVSACPDLSCAGAHGRSWKLRRSEPACLLGAALRVVHVCAAALRSDIWAARDAQQICKRCGTCLSAVKHSCRLIWRSDACTGAASISNARCCPSLASSRFGGFAARRCSTENVLEGSFKL